MRPRDMMDVIKALFPTRRTIAIEGKPGGGKTTICRDVAKELNVGYIEVHMPTMLVEDFGIPMPQPDGTLRYTLPHWYPAVTRTDLPDEIILCFDDRNQAGADLQKILANLCQGRNLHGVPMKKGVMIISTGNRQSDRAGANRILSHLRNRETVYELETHLDDWTLWATVNNVHPLVQSFIRFKPDMLHDFDPQRDQNPTPRSWVEGVSDAIDVVPPLAERETFKGAVGEGASGEFCAFRKVANEMPKVDDVIKSPMTAPVPTNPAVLYALCGALAYKADMLNFASIVKYCDRIPPEFSTLTVTIANRKNADLGTTKAFTEWAVKHDGVLF